MSIVEFGLSDSRYPHELLDIGSDAPAHVYALGNLDLLASPHKAAVIGSRAATPEGLVYAYKLGQKYANAGYVVISGLALGCDTAAHEGCLDAGGKTIAIVGSGLDIVHPKENRALQQRILDNGGLVLSEQPMRIKANPTRLIARNRLQAALVDKVVVAECPEHSGTMHTVRFAMKYGKPVAAIRYDVWNDKNSGNKLIINSIGIEETMEND